MGRGATPAVGSITGRTKISLNAMSGIVGNVPINRRCHGGIRRTVGRLSCRLGTCTHNLGDGHAGAVTIVLPAVTRPCFNLVTRYVGDSLRGHNCQVLLYSASCSGRGRRRVVHVTRRGGISNVVALACSPGLRMPSRVGSISVSQCLNTGVPYITSSGCTNKQLTTRGLVRGNYEGLTFLHINSDVINRAGGHGSNFITTYRTTNIPCRVGGLRSTQSNAIFSPVTRFTIFLSSRLRSNILRFSNVFYIASHLTCRVIRLLHLVKLQIPRSIRIVNFSKLHAFNSVSCCYSAVIRPISTVTRAYIRIILGRGHTGAPSLLYLPIDCTCNNAAGT